MYPPPELRTSHTELLGTTAGIILTAIVAALGLVALIGLVFLMDRPARGTRQTKGNPARQSPGQGHMPSERLEDRHVPEGGHPHGTRSSWVLVAVVTAAFVVGGVAIILHVWWLLWTCIGVVVLAIPAGKATGIMDDTVAWGASPAAGGDLPAGQEGDGVPGRQEGEALPAGRDADGTGPDGTAGRVMRPAGTATGRPAGAPARQARSPRMRARSGRPR